MKCEVCGKEYKEDNIVVCPSMFEESSYPICKECLSNLRIPYNEILCKMIHYEEFAKEYIPYIDATLSFYNKKVEEYNAEVDKLIEDYNIICGGENNGN